jgi:threonine dehydrogenase-like Zn-dependent dehydrogenase
VAERVRAGGEVLQLTAARTLHRDSRPLPTPENDEVVIAPLAVGLCGTDLHAWRGRLDRCPIVPTHDGVAEVTAVGRDVDASLLGRRVVIDPVDACGRCTSCLCGHEGVCTDGGYLGMTVDGLLADRVALPAARVVPVPTQVSDTDATVLEPVAIGCRIASLVPVPGSPAASCVVVGGGPLGLLVGCVLRHAGWDVTVAEPLPDRRRVAEHLELQAAEPARVPDRSAHLVVETSASESGTTAALRAAAPGAVVVVLGRSAGPFPSADVLLRELTVVGLRGGSGFYDAAVQLVAAGVVTPSAVVSHVFERDEVERAFAAHDSDDPPLRAVLRR